MARLRKINQDNLREHNLSVVLKTLLASPEPLSRARLASSTGLTKAAMSLLSGLLIQAGVLQETKRPERAGFGRPATPLGFVPGKWVGIGLQVNTDGFGFCVVDLAGRLMRTEWTSRVMVDADPDEIFTALERMTMPAVESLRRESYVICGSGLALPGLVDDGRTLLSARNLGWQTVNLESYPIVSRLHPKVDNEANFAAIAQIPGYASARTDARTPIGPQDSFVYLSSDIGIGGALVVDGQLVSGTHGYAGEIGHISVNMDGPVCACGRRGCLETYAGRRALVENAGVSGRKGSATRENAERLIRAWKAGDGAARKAVELGERALVSALTSVIDVTDVDTVLLGGFWTRFDDGLAPRLEEDIQSRVIAGGHQSIRVVSCAAGGHPALVGAAQEGLRAFVDHPSAYLDVGD